MTNNLRVQRAIKNITQGELADAIDVSRQTIQSIEAGKYCPSTILALKLAQYFGTTIEQIFQLESED
ncbi:MAG: helix-turn-helix transcriptional regulator [Bacteroidia bacterium]|jgi:putative transcriptional regulator